MSVATASRGVPKGHHHRPYRLSPDQTIEPQSLVSSSGNPKAHGNHRAKDQVFVNQNNATLQQDHQADEAQTGPRRSRWAAALGRIFKFGRGGRTGNDSDHRDIEDDSEHKSGLKGIGRAIGRLFLGRRTPGGHDGGNGPLPQPQPKDSETQDVGHVLKKQLNPGRNDGPELSYAEEDEDDSEVSTIGTGAERSPLMVSSLPPLLPQPSLGSSRLGFPGLGTNLAPRPSEISLELSSQVNNNHNINNTCLPPSPSLGLERSSNLNNIGPALRGNGGAGHDQQYNHHMMMAQASHSSFNLPGPVQESDFQQQENVLIQSPELQNTNNNNRATVAAPLAARYPKMTSGALAFKQQSPQQQHQRQQHLGYGQHITNNDNRHTGNSLIHHHPLGNNPSQDQGRDNHNFTEDEDEDDEWHRNNNLLLGGSGNTTVITKVPPIPEYFSPRWRDHRGLSPLRGSLGSFASPPGTPTAGGGYNTLNGGDGRTRSIDSRTSWNPFNLPGPPRNQPFFADMDSLLGYGLVPGGTGTGTGSSRLGPDSPALSARGRAKGSSKLNRMAASGHETMLKTKPKTDKTAQPARTVVAEGARNLHGSISSHSHDSAVSGLRDSKGPGEVTMETKRSVETGGAGAPTAATSQLLRMSREMETLSMEEQRISKRQQSRTPQSPKQKKKANTAAWWAAAAAKGGKGR